MFKYILVEYTEDWLYYYTGPVEGKSFEWDDDDKLAKQYNNPEEAFAQWDKLIDAGGNDNIKVEVIRVQTWILIR